MTGRPFLLSNGQTSAKRASIGTRSTDELAVMVDTFLPLFVTRQALALELSGYHDSWVPKAP